MSDEEESLPDSEEEIEEEPLIKHRSSAKKKLDMRDQDQVTVTQGPEEDIV